jgi:Tfp pilus assembly protein PilN
VIGRSSTAELTAEREEKAPAASKKTDARAKAERMAAKKAGKAEKADKKNQPVPVLPSVNILSPWVFERMAISRLRHRFALAGFVLVLLIAAGWAIQGLRVDQAEKVLAVEQAETARLTAETNELASVKTFIAAVGQQQLTVQGSMAGEIYFSRVLEELQNATPFAAKVDTLSVVLDPNAAAAALGTAPTPAEAIPTASPCPGPDPFNTKLVIGCITLSGSAGTRADVGEFVINLGAEELFVEPFISTTTAGDGSITFSGSVGLSEKVYSGRYAQLDKLLKAKGSR